MEFKLTAEYQPTGDQPQAIAQLVAQLNVGRRHNTLLGVTGSGKTFTMANVVAQVNRPTLVLCHNKTLAAQLYQEFKNFFPENAVEYYVSYYDYYQPEAYLPTTGTYIEKDLSINDEIEKMRLSTTTTLLSGRRDVIVVSSVSCIYGIGNPEDFKATSINLAVGESHSLKVFLYKLVEALYTRTERELNTGTFRVNGDSVDIMSAYGDKCYRITMFDDEIEAIEMIDPMSGQRLSSLDSVTIFPANLFVTTKERIAHAIGQIYVDMGTQVAEFEARGREIEAQRLKQRVEYDLEMIKELGYCSGIENYSRYFDNRKPGVPPFCLLNYFPEDFITIVDESHVTLPQIRGMYGGDRARKVNLVEYGFRLEAAKDNRPLSFEEYEALVGTSIYVSATPGDYELQLSNYEVVEQLIRPTGLTDPPMTLRPAMQQIDDLVEEVHQCIANHDKVMITTITKRMAEEVSKYLDRLGVRNRYIHSDIDTLERVQILDDLRNDLFDVVVGVNLLREGLDLPEVALVAILDADKEGFLRNKRSLIQIAGRAARHAKGEAILYGENCTDSLATAIMTANKQRMIQIRYNLKHQQLPRQAQKSGGTNSTLLASRPTEQTLSYTPLPVEQHYQIAAEPAASYTASPPKERHSYRKSGVVDYTTGEVIYLDEEPKATEQAKSFDELIAEAKSEMEAAAKALDFTAAMQYRDRMYELIKARDTKVSYK
ncbi:MAG: excinuclease ABC subunit UvrB [Rikenellaceae bacterium]